MMVGTVYHFVYNYLMQSLSYVRFFHIKLGSGLHLRFANNLTNVKAEELC